MPYNFCHTKRLFFIIATLVVVFFVGSNALAAVPSGNDWFQLLTSHTTGGDNTGDGDGTLNYYYVGQQITSQIQIQSGGATAANIWIDYNATNTTASNLTTGTFFNVWSGQTINANARGTNLGRIYSTGYNLPVTPSSGTGTFGSVRWRFNQPSEAAYGISSPETFDINIGNFGSTTESNISLSGIDILDDAEDFQFHIWADTIKPYAQNPSPTDSATAVAADSNFVFELRDSLNGEGDDSGVGTGVNTATPPGIITVDDGSGAVDYTAYDNYSCSGLWGTNLCNVTVNPASISGISGDARNWEYDATYSLSVSGFRDLASNNQDQLGDTNGPNTMDAKSWSFTTESDTVKPQVESVSPARGSNGNAVDTNIVVEITDKRTYPGNVSGTGINPTTCRINVSSPSLPLTTYNSASSGMTVTAIDYGYRFTINPSSSFTQNETVSVSAYDCTDLAAIPNIMTTDNWTFTIIDSDTPYIEGLSPADDAFIDQDGTVSFHIKDNGTGIDLSNIVVFLNGDYYTNGGGAGSVTTVGTHITFSDSFDFNGGNYSGDTTGVSGSSNDYILILDPETNFNSGEAVPIIVYAEDQSGNIMERAVFAVSVQSDGDGDSCDYECADNQCCGRHATWDGHRCVGNPGGAGVLYIKEECGDCICDEAGNPGENIIEKYISTSTAVCPPAEDLICPVPEDVICSALEQDDCPGADQLCANCITECPTTTCQPASETDNETGIPQTSDEIKTESAASSSLMSLLAAMNLDDLLDYIFDNTPIDELLAKINQFMSTETAGGIAMVALAAMAGLTLLQLLSLLNSLAQLPQIFTNLFHYLGFGHAPKPGSGVAYDATTGQPVGFADVKVVDKKGKEIEFGTTNREGFYEFKEQQNADVKVITEKNGYRMMNDDELNNLPTAYSPTFTDSSSVNFSQKQMAQPGMPMKKEDSTGLEKMLNAIKIHSLSSALFWSGLAFNIYYTLANPSTINYAISGSYVFTGLIKAANVIKPTFGAVKAPGIGVAAHTVVKAVNKTTGDIFGRAVTSDKGKYSFILPKGKFDLVAETLNGKGIKTVNIRNSQVVNKNISIKPIK